VTRLRNPAPTVPRVVYHGTTYAPGEAHIERFRGAFQPFRYPAWPSGEGKFVGVGTFFSESQEVASSYPLYTPKGAVRAVHRVRLTINRPKVYTTARAAAKDMVARVGSDPVAFVALLRAEGYDGITFMEGPSYNPSDRTKKARVWIPFSPEQVHRLDASPPRPLAPAVLEDDDDDWEEDMLDNPRHRNPRRRSASPLRWYVRFGDPRTVKGGRSVIHDPEAYAYAEEPALYAFELGESPPRLQSEGGISAYEVLAFDGDKVVARIPIGLVTFSRQMGGFLEERVLRDDAWVFQGREVGRGTDGEPLVDASSIRGVRHVGTKNLWGTDRHGDAPPPSSWKRLLDLYDVWDLRHGHDMGYDEFFRKRASEVLRRDITDYVDGLRSRFTTREQVAALDAIEASWLQQWDEDHGRQMNPRRRNPAHEEPPDCAWCGSPCDQPRPYPNQRGEVFCSPSHRTSSNRALARLLGRETPSRRRR